MRKYRVLGSALKARGTQRRGVKSTAVLAEVASKFVALATEVGSTFTERLPVIGSSLPAEYVDLQDQPNCLCKI